MHTDQYVLVKDPKGHFYEFKSIGPKGTITKSVQYHRIKGYPPNIFNLSFGDWNRTQKRIDDQIITNNGDRDMVLATVAATVKQFTADFPNAVIYVEGSTPARTRLYQIGISKFWHEISQDFVLEGFRQGYWEGFHKGVNYECFLLKRRIKS
jgi:hypothetical protein